MLAHILSFGRNPRVSLDFLAYPVPKACMHVLGAGVPRCLGVARSASSPKAAQALGLSLTPGLRISFGPDTCMARAASVPGLWTLSFLLLRGACVWVWVVLRLGFSAAPRHSWLGCWGVCAGVHAPGWGVRCRCVCLGSGFGCAPPLLAGVSGPVSACVRAPLIPRHSWLACAVCVGVCFSPGFGCTPPHLAGLLGCVCDCVRASLVPLHSWFRCVSCVCVLGLRFRLRPASPGWGVGVCVFVYALRLYPATPGLHVRRGCVCLGSGFVCAPPVLAGVLGCVCVRVHAPLVPRHFWLGCAALACVIGLRFVLRFTIPGLAVGLCVFVLRLYPASPSWGVWCGCVCLGSDFGLSLPLLAGMSGYVCACVRAPLVPHHSWQGCAPWVCVLGLGFPLRPASLGWAVGGCVFVCSLRLWPATPGWGVRRGCVCLRSGFGCAPPLPAGLLGCVCAPVRAPLVPRHSWLGCAMWVGLLGLGFGLCPATPGWDVGVCVCFCVRSACTPPLLAGLCSVGVCALALVSPAPPHNWRGC